MHMHVKLNNSIFI